MLPKRPIERRRLWLPGNKGSIGTRGTLSLWVDMLDTATAKAHPPLDIALPPPTPYVLRVVIWRVRGARSMDSITDQNDMFVVGRVEGTNPADGALIREQKQTDTHWRCKGGKASFNYRISFEVQVPLQHCRFVLQAWDRDLVGSNDMIGEATISLQGLFSKAQRARFASEGRGSNITVNGGGASGGMGGVSLSGGAQLRYPSEEASRLAVEESSDDAPGAPSPGKPGRAAALKAMRKGNPPEKVSEMLMEAGHGNWTPQELTALERHDQEKRNASGEKANSCWSTCSSTFSNLLRCCRRGGRGVYSLITNTESPVSPNSTVWIPLKAPAASVNESQAAANQGCCAGFCGGAGISSGQEGEESVGWVEIEMELMTAQDAKQRAAGEGQNKPNDFPYLPPPSRVSTVHFAGGAPCPLIFWALCCHFCSPRPCLLYASPVTCAG